MQPIYWAITDYDNYIRQVVLANEAGMCYAAIALVTDYDCWRDVAEEHHVSTCSSHSFTALLFINKLHLYKLWVWCSFVYIPNVSGIICNWFVLWDCY